MQILLRPDTRVITVSADDDRLLAIADERLTIQLQDTNGDAKAFAAGDALELTIKAAGKRNTQPLTINGAIDVDSETGKGSIDINAYTDGMTALLGIDNGVSTDDELSALCDFDLLYTPSGGDPVQSFPAQLTVVAPVRLPSDTDPATLPTKSFRVSDDGAYIEFLVNGAVVGKGQNIVE